MTNTNVILSISPAAQWCRDKGEKWYLPALDEMKEVLRNNNYINETFSALGVQLLGTENNPYWTSTTYDATTARTLKLSNGENKNNNKKSTLNVRAVRVL